MCRSFRPGFDMSLSRALAKLSAAFLVGRPCKSGMMDMEPGGHLEPLEPLELCERAAATAAHHQARSTVPRIASLHLHVSSRLFIRDFHQGALHTVCLP
mmetsp:Transcript_2232/g.2733  ORF Transcript_2232/g.2733 Transcript_2232/m.2733 type:complete len:99 (-) Transcript_2232:38-334(-)